MDIQDIKNRLQQAKQWEDRYRLIIQCGKQLPVPSDAQLAQMPLLQGCEAKVWFKIDAKNDRTFHFTAIAKPVLSTGCCGFCCKKLKIKTLHNCTNLT